MARITFSCLMPSSVCHFVCSLPSNMTSGINSFFQQPAPATPPVPTGGLITGASMGMGTSPSTLYVLDIGASHIIYQQWDNVLTFQGKWTWTGKGSSGLGDVFLYGLPAGGVAANDQSLSVPVWSQIDAVGSDNLGALVLAGTDVIAMTLSNINAFTAHFPMAVGNTANSGVFYVTGTILS